MRQASMLDKAMNALVLSEPFYACILLQRTLVEYNNEQMRAYAGRPYLAVTDGTTITINTERVVQDGVGRNQLIGLLQHEVEHIARLHPWRRQGRDHNVWNQACDHVINLSILAGGGSLPEGGLADSKYNNWTEEEVYVDLMDKRESGQKNGGMGGEPGDGDDVDLMMEPENSTREADMAEAKELVIQAAGAAKARGKLPGHAKHLLDGLAPPSKDWREELKEFVVSFSQTDYSWNRPSRMWVTRGVYLPSMDSDGAMGTLVTIFDTSGSVSNDELRIYFGDLCAAVEAVRPTCVKILYVDSGVSAVDTFDSPTDADIRAVARREGGGGTDMRVGLDWIDENLDDVAACIVFTDGDTPFGQPRNYPVLWAISGTAVSPWGRTLTLPTTVAR